MRHALQRQGVLPGFNKSSVLQDLAEALLSALQVDGRRLRAFVPEHGKSRLRLLRLDRKEDRPSRDDHQGNCRQESAGSCRPTDTRSVADHRTGITIKAADSL